MLPFLPPFVNQNQVQRGNDPPPNLFTSSSSALPNEFGFNNPQMLMPAMGGFNNQNAFLSTLLTQQHMMQGQQNNLMGVFVQQWMMFLLPGQQLNLLGALQNPNFMSLQHGGLLGRPPMGQNLNQMLGFSPNGLLGLQNPIFPPNAQLPVIGSGNSNPGLLGNGSALVGQRSSRSKRRKKRKTSHKLQKPNLPGPVQNIKSNNGRQLPQSSSSSKGLETRKTSQKLQEPNLPGPVQNIKSNNGHQLPQSSGSSKGLETRKTSQKLQEPNLPGPVQNIKSNNGCQLPQMKQGQTGGKSFSNNSESDNLASNNINPKFNEQGKMEPSHMRFQKSQSYNSRNARQKERRFAKNNRRGQQQTKERTTTFSASNTRNLRKRPLSVGYSESEIQQWREARKNNFPIRTNIEKKLKSESANKEEMDSHAKIRRQQLKEVLAKQAELGVTYPTKFDDKNYKFAYKMFMKRNAKRRKLKYETATAHEPVVKKREPILFRKLSNANIRRHKASGVPNNHSQRCSAQPKSEKKPLDSDTNVRVENGNAEEFERKTDSALVGAVESEGDKDNDSI